MLYNEIENDILHEQQSVFSTQHPAIIGAAAAEAFWADC